MPNGSNQTGCASTRVGVSPESCRWDKVLQRAVAIDYVAPPGQRQAVLCQRTAGDIPAETLTASGVAGADAHTCMQRKRPAPLREAHGITRPT